MPAKVRGREVTGRLISVGRGRNGTEVPTAAVCGATVKDAVEGIVHCLLLSSISVAMVVSGGRRTRYEYRH